MTAIDGRTVAVTGGTGAVGSALVLALVAMGAREVRVLARSHRTSSDPAVTFIRGDLASTAALSELLEGAEGLFHLAGLKDVTECERDPRAAIATNVDGSQSLLEAACASRSLRWAIGTSSVSAAAPANVYGLTKALMERAFHASNGGRTQFASIRLPGLWHVPGSVLDHWLADALAGRPIAVTDPDMTRAAMTREDAVRLLASLPESIDRGDVVVPACRAYRLGDLATVASEAFGVGVRLAGRRAGEKLHEDLIAPSEVAFTTSHRAGWVITFGLPQSGTVAMSTADLPRYDLAELRAVVRDQRVPV